MMGIVTTPVYPAWPRKACRMAGLLRKLFLNIKQSEYETSEQVLLKKQMAN
jgi:hypothetical protein